MVRRFIIVGFLLVYHSVQSAHFVEKVGDLGLVDWTDFLIHTRGRGNENPSLPLEVRKESALDAAKKDALVKLLQLVNKINFDSELSVGELLASNDSLHVEVMSTVSENLRIVDRVYLSDGSVELEVELPLLGPVMSLLLPEVGGVQWTAGKVPQKTFTGVVIDARGLPLKPSLLPRVLNEDRAEVYGKSTISREPATRIGVCGWIKDSLDVKDTRVGNSPLILKAQSVSGDNSTDLIISNEDAIILHASPKSPAILKACRLSIILN